jgi:hypothetical protein
MDPMETDAQILQRWIDLRTMLNDQLQLFERGALVLRSNGVDISDHAVADLTRSIREFDALITEGEAGGA